MRLNVGPAAFGCVNPWRTTTACFQDEPPLPVVAVPGHKVVLGSLSRGSTYQLMIATYGSGSRNTYLRFAANLLHDISAEQNGCRSRFEEDPTFRSAAGMPATVGSHFGRSSPASRQGPQTPLVASAQTQYSDSTSLF